MGLAAVAAGGLRGRAIAAEAVLATEAAKTPSGARPPSRAEVEVALNKSGAPSDLQRLAATAEASLQAIAADSKAAEGLRGRALTALGYAHDAPAHTFLENMVTAKTPSSDATDRVLLRRAAVALGWQGGARVVDLVAPLLDHPDAEVRLDAAVALGLTRARAADKPLRARLEAETDPSVRRQLQSALRDIGSGR